MHKKLLLVLLPGLLASMSLQAETEEAETENTKIESIKIIIPICPPGSPNCAFETVAHALAAKCDKKTDDKVKQPQGAGSTQDCKGRKNPY